MITKVTFTCAKHFLFIGMEKDNFPLKKRKKILLRPIPITPKWKYALGKAYTGRVQVV